MAAVGSGIQDVSLQKQIQDASPQKLIHDAHQNLELLQWNCDQIGTPKSDSLVHLLDTATWQYASTLISFTLDVSLLSEIGFTLVQNILHRSHLDRLHIRCTPIDLDQRQNIHHLLQSVQWSLVTSLVLFGDHLDEWIQLLAESNTPFLNDISVTPHRLQHFGIVRVGATPQKLSRSNALFLHRLVYPSPLLDMHLENMEMQDKRDWGLLAEMVDCSRLESVRVLERSVRQSMAAMDVLDLFCVLA